MSKVDISKAAAALGRRGGKVKGPAKRRGDSDHYRALVSARESITVRNNRHFREITLRPRDGWLSPTQVKRSKRGLCGIAECLCGGALGERGPQSFEVVDARADGSIKVRAR